MYRPIHHLRTLRPRRDGAAPAPDHHGGRAADAPARLPAVWTARPAGHGVGRSLATIAALVLLVPLVASAGTHAAQASGTTISGTAFQDADADGVQRSGDEPFVDHLILLSDSSGSVIATDRTDEQGRYSFDVTPDESYKVSYAGTSWREIWAEWVPTTTDSLEPVHADVQAGDVADFAWREIVTSDDIHDPISVHVGAERLTVRSYNDVITAEQIYEHISNEFLVGDEAAGVTVRFARPTNSASSIYYSDRVLTTVNVTYISWLRNGDRMLAHEYGHAWMNYHNHLVMDDYPGWTSLLEARGLDPDDDRLGSSHAWRPGEIAAEDYRQLFASDNARSGGQMNTSIPRPWDVDGYESFLREEFSAASGGADDGEDTKDDDATDEDDSTDDGDDTKDEDDTTDGDDGTDNGDDTTGEDDGDDGSKDEDPLLITSPEDEAEVDRDIEVAGHITAEFNRVDVTIDGERLRADLNDDGSWQVVFTDVSIGEHEVSAVARGPRGLRQQATVTVTVTGEESTSDDDSSGNNGRGNGNGRNR